MKKNYFILSVVSSLLLLSSLASADETCLLKSKINFEQINTQVVDLFKEQITSMGIDFKLQSEWNDQRKNAAALKIANNWVIQMGGGMYNDKVMTNDAQAMATCHELGHLIGGAPYKMDMYGSKMSTEGQADFWASAVCFKKYVRTYPVNQEMSDKSVQSLCLNNYKNNPASAVNECYRSIKAAESLSHFFANLNSETKPNINTSSTIKVLGTQTQHPNAQCRLDTLKAGTLCQMDETISKNLDYNISAMNCEIKNDKINLRPDCWFDPNFYSWNLSHTKLNSKSTQITINMANNKSGEYRIKVLPLSEGVTIKNSELAQSSKASMFVKEYSFQLMHKKKANIKYSIEVYYNNVKIHSEIKEYK